MIEPVVINENANITKIYHMADIHIRRYERHAEYEYVFNKLYQYLKSVADEESLIIICGDIFHSKDNLTPDSVIKTDSFLRSLASIMPVIMIAGNHDMVETNKTIKDSLSAIFNDTTILNLHYLKYTNAYRYGNIILGVSSLYDASFIKADTIVNNNKLLIGLYHGAVGACSTSVGVVLNGDKKISDFDGYDYVLLGDIHKYQYMNKEKTIAYSSSLISQNFTETDKDHGVLVWDLVNKKSSYMIVENMYRHMFADIRDNNMIIDGETIDINTYVFPSHAKIRLNIYDIDKMIIEKIKKTIRKKYPNIVFYERVIQSESNKNTDNTNNIQSINYKQLLESFTDKLNEEEKEECVKLFIKSVEEFNMTTERQLCNWELLDIKFSNMFAYGENNIIDFTKLPFNDIVGLFAPNSHGKSTLIDIILFSLYENFSRNVYSIHRTIPSYIVNNTKTWFETIIRFKLGNDIYTIHKNGTLVGKFKSKTGKTIIFNTNTFIKYSNGVITNLTRKDRFETQKEVNNIIGTYEDFCLTTLFLQNGEKNFYDMKTTERKEFLFNILNLDKFDKMYNIFKNEEKYSKIIKDDLEKRIGDIDIDNVIEQYEDRKKSINRLNRKIDKVSIIKQQINNKRQKVMKLLNNDSYISNLSSDDFVILYDIDILERNLNIANMMLDNYTIIQLDNYDNIINDFNKIMYSINNLNHIDSDINITNIIDNIKKLNGLILNESHVISNYEKYKLIETKRNQINYKLEFINKQIDTNIINEKCSVCIKRKPVYDSFIKQKDELTKELCELYYEETWNSDYIDLQNNKKILSDCINKYNIYRKQLCNMIVCNYENPIFIDKSDIILNYIEHLKNNIKYVKNMDAIKMITKLDNMLEKVDIKLSGYNKELTQLTYEMALYKSQYDEYNNIRDNMKKNLVKYNIYSVLKKASHINGVPSKIISTRLDEVNTRVNELISQFINKKVFVLLDGTNILVHIKDNMDNIINILGGMEMFIINIAFKIALANVSIIPKNKMIIIDEGVSVLDKQHIERFDKIAMFLNSNYDHVILISHIDSLKDFISHYITINKNGENLSYIDYH